MQLMAGKLNSRQRRAVETLERKFAESRDANLTEVFKAARDRPTATLEMDARYPVIMHSDFACLFLREIIGLDNSCRLDFDKWKLGICESMSSVTSIDEVSDSYSILYVRAASDIIRRMDEIREMA